MRFTQFGIIWTCSFITSESWTTPRSLTTYDRLSSHNHDTNLISTTPSSLFLSPAIENEDNSELYEPAKEEAKFGRQAYWDNVYKQGGESPDDETSQQADTGFSWYSTWDDLEPFWADLVEPLHNRNQIQILVPGVGNDGCIVGMHDAGWKCITAFDYSPEGVALARELLGESRLQNTATVEGGGSVNVDVADARSLPYSNDTFDAVFDKGTLDVVFLSGGQDRETRLSQLSLAVKELARVVRPSGIVMSITAIATDEIDEAFNEDKACWRQIRDGKSIYITEDGYTSNNVDATILAWERL